MVKWSFDTSELIGKWDAGRFVYSTRAPLTVSSVTGELTGNSATGLAGVPGSEQSTFTSELTGEEGRTEGARSCHGTLRENSPPPPRLPHAPFSSMASQRDRYTVRFALELLRF